MTPRTAPTDPTAAFCTQLSEALHGQQFVKAVLAKYRGGEAGLERIDMRLVALRGEPMLQLVYHHSTRDVTHNHSLMQGLALVRSLLGSSGFRNAHLHTHGGTFEWSITQRGQAHLRHRAAVAEQAETPNPSEVSLAHNREKQRMLTLDRPFLLALGVTAAAAKKGADAQTYTVVPAMARKWKQINKFLEVFAAALAASTLAEAKQLNVVDFGSGKGYLTFALHDWLTRSKHVDAQVTGVELRADMVALGQAVVDKLGIQGLRMVQGDVRSWQPEALNVMVALHACDTATDHAIDLGVRGGADIILCSPCCHKELRPQLLSPHPMRPILQHGVHMGQQAEMVTDGLRAMLLEAAGYDTQVFEFVSLEHTNKNKMILAVKRAAVRSPEPVLAQIAEIKAFYGIREQCLETLLAARLASSPTITHERTPKR